jgi:tetratricopeptide (TPR) repeat protein
LRFQWHLEQLATFGKSQGIAMLWYVPAGSEAGYEPNRSVVKSGTPQGEIAALQKCAAQARDREQAEEWAAAAELYFAALARHPEFAEFHFRLGECLLKLERIDEARTHFQEALDLDGQPVRLTAPFRKTIADVASTFSIPVVFTADILRRQSPLGIIDRSLIHDDVHPTLRGFYEMGLAGADELRTSGLLDAQLGRPAEIPAARFPDAIHEMRIDRADLVDAYRRVANALLWLSRLRFDPTRRQAQANQYLRMAERLEAGQIDPGEEGTEALH